MTLESPDPFGVSCPGGFVDGRIDHNGMRVSVRDLRRALWAEHLGIAAAAVPDLPGNHPQAIDLWKRGVATGASVRAGDNARSTAPPLANSRLYEWPFDDVFVAAVDLPRVEFLRNGAVLEIPGYGIRSIPLPWWFIEGYGKAPWAPDSDTLVPPPIGSDRFAFDGEPGTEYAAHDLQHP